MRSRIALFALASLAFAGCGGGSGYSDHVFALTTGRKWTYKVTGTVTLPASQGGGTQSVREDGSTLTFQVPTDTAKDAAGSEVRILDRSFNLTLTDARQVVGDLRLYFTQTSQGIFVHGVHSFVGPPTGQPTWVPATALPPYQFAYLPDPAADGVTLNYSKPFDTLVSGGYSLQIAGPRQMVTVPAGTFSAKQIAINEAFDGFTLNPTTRSEANFCPEAGILSGTITAKLADGTSVNGTIKLTSVQ